MNSGRRVRVGPGEDAVARNRALQAEWYGEPLGDRVRRILSGLGLSQSALARVLGLSPPMLSQLMSGHRAKISNPAVLGRLLAVEDLAADPATAALPAAELRTRLDEIRSVAAPALGRPPLERPAARAVQALLREVASAAEIEAAAALIAAEFPDLADVLRIYGTGRAGDAEEHFRRILGN
ncbi:helix-turn-helix domain-containing protein [Actinomadura rubteroloni]|uniref:helix-turn-helix domain-containing protein n=1 Tax=Actinomadura rubteroloni TaxID=1926885 RepID=UPI00196A6B85|nr:helix-turn-helix domain-containing protein [Actinomadura rubteroloni]